MFLTVLTFFTIIVLSYLYHQRYRKIDLKDVHCLITGGSSGIGLALAIQVVKCGGNVTIVARSLGRLASAKESILSQVRNQNQKVLSFSADVASDENTLKEIVEEAEKASGPVDVLFNCAGTSVCYPFLETSSEDFSKMLDVNYLGSVNMARAVLPSMMHRKDGIIVFVSSVAGLMGLYGYTAYSASKFALLGFAESLQMEVKPFNISITVAFPPDTDTPGFAEEIKHKPLETMRISESAGLHSAEKVSSTILRDSLNKKFMSTVGLDGYIVSVLCCGMTPVRSILELTIQVITMGLYRLASFFILWQFDRIVQKCAEEKRHLRKEDRNSETS